MNLKILRTKILTIPLIEKTYHYLMNYFVDVYIVSFPKSGRTWVRMLLAQALSLEYGLSLNLDLYKMTLGQKLPIIKTDPRTGSYSSFKGSQQLGRSNFFKNKKIILLVRDPRDVLVSYYYEWTKRRELKYELPLSSFIKEEFTLPRIIRFMNSWAEEIKARPSDVLLITYESLHQDAQRELERMINFLLIDISSENVRMAVEKSSFNQMLKMEQNSQFSGDHRLEPTNPEDRNSYKMRQGIVGGYLRAFSQQDLTFLNKELKEKLNSIYNYK